MGRSGSLSNTLMLFTTTSSVVVLSSFRGSARHLSVAGWTFMAIATFRRFRSLLSGVIQGIGEVVIGIHPDEFLRSLVGVKNIRRSIKGIRNCGGQEHSLYATCDHLVGGLNPA